MDFHKQAIAGNAQTAERENISKTHHILNGNLSLSDLDRYLSDIKPSPKLSAHLMALLAERDLSCEEFAMMANIGRSTVYKIINGKQLPEQDMLLRMAFVLRLSGQETQQLLKAGHRAQLTSSRTRDVAIIVGLQNQLTLDEMDEVLLERDLSPLTPIEKKLSDLLSPLMKDLSFDQMLEKAHLRTPAFLSTLSLSGRENGLDALDAVCGDLEKDDLIKICFALGLKPAEAQRLLRIAHRAFLSTRDERDLAIIKGLSEGMTLEAINAALLACGADSLL